ncbi:MAG: hypothetical protein AAFY11_09395, partial [Cyanobacteria bacterium J06641_5]
GMPNWSASQLSAGKSCSSQPKTPLLAVAENYTICPLTIDLPTNLAFPARDTFQACKDVSGMRQWVERELGLPTGASFPHRFWFGDHWLPIVLTAKGPLYAEAIGEGETPNAYQQPVDLSDRQRQPLYHLAQKLLETLAAPPAVYLLQFGWQDGRAIFDRLWPFPAAPAIASLGVQEPDLFACHWHCLREMPLYDVAIAPANLTV